jgi:site-specific recombinase XerD
VFFGCFSIIVSSDCCVFGKFDIPHQKKRECDGMDMSEQQFLESVSNKSTKKGYKHGLKVFSAWYGKSVEEILKERQDDLSPRTGEGLVEYRNRGARFGRELEKFHTYLQEKKGYAVNSARVCLNGLLQLFRYFEMPLKLRNGSKCTRTEEAANDFPLAIEQVRAMFQIADLRERVILSMATDLGLRITDFISIKKASLPSLDQEPPISFVVMTAKKRVVAKGFLSAESVSLLKLYLPTLEQRTKQKGHDNQFLFPSNTQSHISDQWTNDLIRDLAAKAGVVQGSKNLHFHCFRKLFLSSAIDSGCGLTAGKLMCGKSIPKSDSTYLTTVKLREKFVQLKKFLSIQEQPKVETEKLEALKSAVTKLQEELTQQKLITETICQQNLKVKPLIDFIDGFESAEKLETFLNLLKVSSEISFPEHETTLLRLDFSQERKKWLDEKARAQGKTVEEILRQIIEKSEE